MAKQAKSNNDSMTETQKVSTRAKRSCEVCTNPSTKKCGNCKKAHYCSASCQKKHWKLHKDACKKK